MSAFDLPFDEFEDDDLFYEDLDEVEYPARSRIPPPFEPNEDDDPADSDPEFEYDDDGTGPDFEI